MKREELKKIIIKISEGVVANLTDFILVQIFFTLELTGSGKITNYTADRAIEAAHNQLTEVNYQQLKLAVYRLKKKGLVKYIKREKILLPQITAAGKKRLKNLLPVYDEKRIWDKRIYLVTYDIPEKKKFDRDTLREYLKKIGCGMLQASVWLTPYNPKEVLREFIEERKLAGQVLISDLGEDGSIGEEDLRELVVRVYNLEDLENRYVEFIQKWGGKKKLNDSEKTRIYFAFTSILMGDPQLPFELLPEDWAGNNAYKLFRFLT